jgi:hypothetical protein
VVAECEKGVSYNRLTDGKQLGKQRRASRSSAWEIEGVDEVEECSKRGRTSKGGAEVRRDARRTEARWSSVVFPWRRCWPEVFQASRAAAGRWDRCAVVGAGVG